VVDHLGRPEDAGDLAGLDRIRALAAAPAVAIKLSGLYAFSRQAYPYRDTWDWVEGAVAAFGPDRTMWGSDWPLATESAPYRDQVALVGLLPFLDDTARRQVMGETARRFWWNGTDVVQ
jgi:L-fuconolactonase